MIIASPSHYFDSITIITSRSNYLLRRDRRIHHCRNKMSAYGAISRPFHAPKTPLSPTLWSIPQKNGGVNSSPSCITLHHFIPSNISQSDLVGTLYEEFADEVERGTTYPQEVLPAGTRLSREAFESYFFAGDVFVAIIGGSALASKHTKASIEVEGVQAHVLDGPFHLDAAKADREWSDCVAGFYYVIVHLRGKPR